MKLDDALKCNNCCWFIELPPMDYPDNVNIDGVCTAQCIDVECDRMCDKCESACYMCRNQLCEDFDVRTEVLDGLEIDDEWWRLASSPAHSRILSHVVASKIQRDRWLKYYHEKA